MHPDDSYTLFLDDQLLLRKESYVQTRTRHTLSCKMLRKFSDDASGKQYRLKAKSYTELLKHAKLSPLAIIPEGLNTLPATSDLAPDPPRLRTPLTPISVNPVWSYDMDIERHAGLTLPLQSDAQPSPRYGSMLSPPPNRSVRGGKTVSPSVSDGRGTRDNQQYLREYYASRQSHLMSQAAPAYSAESNVQQGDPQPEAGDSSCFTNLFYTVAIFGALILGYRFWFKAASPKP